MGDKRACLRAMREAENAFSRRDEADDPDWIGYFDAAELHDEFGHCFTALRQVADAEHHTRIALTHSGDAYPRSRTFCRLSLATAYLVRKDVEQACTVAAEAVQVADRLKSART
ncbi:hypothetical protein [Actinopolymorpha alba]|uniref:hypothetical protein n=1 Tax=Actinopolymorpha alba TaxID=533267 RepID=UPI0012F6E898|nr:hypothetical protein [Actinopolymorpha alba]